MTTALTGPGKKGVGNCWGVENMEEALKQQGFTEITFCPNEVNPFEAHAVAKKEQK